RRPADPRRPAASGPVQVEGGADPLVVKSSSTLVSTHADPTDLTYTVNSRQPPGAVQPLTAAQIDGTGAPLPPEMRAFTKLPADFPSDVRDTAVTVTAGAATPHHPAPPPHPLFPHPPPRLPPSPPAPPPPPPPHPNP